jgi:hypothetical protein
MNDVPLTVKCSSLIKPFNWACFTTSQEFTRELASADVFRVGDHRVVQVHPHKLAEQHIVDLFNQATVLRTGEHLDQLRP